MSDPQIRDLFASDVTRDIPPVVYFHEQSPEKLQAEVSEYIITGGWPEGHPNRRRVPDGIHEQYVRLLTAIADALEKPGGPELPTAWISGFYGSGKSSFAKLLGLALDGVALPDGRSMADAWLRRDTSPDAPALAAAWKRLRAKVDPLAVVFDIGGVARDGEHIHSATIRQVQRRLGYCASEPLVADFELKLERDGQWAAFEAAAERALDRPWSEAKDRAFAEEDFSLVLSAMFPEHYTDPMAWITSRAGSHSRNESPEEAVRAIQDMLRFRRPQATLFLVVDEVSQYVLANKDRVDRLRVFASALGATLKGKAWLLALGQQKLDEGADDSFLVWAKDRFPPRLRVHLATTNIRDVVHKRLLHKTPEAEALLRARFEVHRADLKLFAYRCEAVTPEEFVEVYPMLPGQIDLLLEITSALRTRSARAQGDDQAIRGLLQLLGELFRSERLADQPIGALVTLDAIYAVQHTALDSDVQDSMARILARCSAEEDALLVRAAKAVALLELIQERLTTDAKLVAQSLYDRLDRGNQVSAVTEALEELRRRNLLGYSEKTGYKLQSSAAEEWERERREFGVPRETISDRVQEGLKRLLAEPDKPRLQGRPFPYAGLFSDGRHAEDARLVDPRDDAAVRVDFRFLTSKERVDSTWVRQSAETALAGRLVWVSGDPEQLDDLCREHERSRRMVNRYKPRRDSLNAARRLLLTQEENRAEDLVDTVNKAIAATWMAGRMYFRGRAMVPSEQGPGFAVALHAAATSVLQDLFPHFLPTQVQPSELLQLTEAELSGPSPKFLIAELGVLELDAGRYVPTCGGVVPRRVQEHLEAEGGLSGTGLLAHFGGPPYGYTANVVKACALGLLRAGKLTIQPEGGAEISAVRDAGVRELFEKDRLFRRANFFPAGEDDIGFQARARICKFFDRQLGHKMDREDHAIADAVAQHFPGLAHTSRSVRARLDRLPGPPDTPADLAPLADILERCVASARRTKPTVKLVKRHLDGLRDGVTVLKTYDAELTDAALRAVQEADRVLHFQAEQLEKAGVEASNLAAARVAIADHLGRAQPWREIGALDGHLADTRTAYTSEREAALRWQAQQAEVARGQVKARDGFSTLTGDQAHKVLRPLAEVLTDTTAEAVAPALAELKTPWLPRLEAAVEEANERLDGLLSKGDGGSGGGGDPPVFIVRVDVTSRLRNRVLRSEADVDALLADLRDRLTSQMRAGKHVRLA